MKWINNKWKLASIVFTGFMFMGLGVGMLFNETGAGIMIGMGVGFAAYAIVLISQRENETLP